MKLKSKRSVLLCIVLSLIISLTACANDLPAIMDDGASNFGAGKTEEDYSLQNSGTLLERLISDYSGSYHLPTSSQMDDDAYDKAAETADADPDAISDVATGQDSDQSSDQNQVGNWDDFLRVCHNACLKTVNSFEFDLADGYTLDLFTDLEECFVQLQRDDPINVSCIDGWCWGQRGNHFIIEIIYTMDTDELIRIKDDTMDLVNAAAASINAGNMTEYEIVLAVNEYLCDTVYYPEQEPYAPVTHTAYGALNNGVAVCEGYACAAKLLLNKLGVQCDIQVGFCTDGGGHAWNLVNVDGQWYQMDVTWNDGSYRRTDYLLVTDDYMLKSRTWDYGDYPASATTAYVP